MPGTLARNLHLCFKWSSEPLSPPETPMSLDDHSLQCSTNTSSSTFVKNFNSLYDDAASKSLSRSSSALSAANENETAANFSAVLASQRFFFSSPGRSNSIVESTTAPDPDPEDSIWCSRYTVPTPHPQSRFISDSACLYKECGNTQQKHKRVSSDKDSVIQDGVAVPTYSPDPYSDFRRSMQEMVEARALMDVQSNWEYLHGLLISYLALNPKSTHKLIVSAFADLLVTLLSTSPEGGGCRKRDLVAG